MIFGYDSIFANSLIGFDIRCKFKIDEEDVIRAYVYLNNPVEVVKTIITNISNKKIVPIDSELDSVTIYSNKDNIKKLKENKYNYNNSFEEDDEFYEE